MDGTCWLGTFGGGIVEWSGLVFECGLDECDCGEYDEEYDEVKLAFVPVMGNDMR